MSNTPAQRRSRSPMMASPPTSTDTDDEATRFFTPRGERTSGSAHLPPHSVRGVTPPHLHNENANGRVLEPPKKKMELADLIVEDSDGDAKGVTPPSNSLGTFGPRPAGLPPTTPIGDQELLFPLIPRTTSKDGIPGTSAEGDAAYDLAGIPQFLADNEARYNTQVTARNAAVAQANQLACDKLNEAVHAKFRWIQLAIGDPRSKERQQAQDFDADTLQVIAKTAVQDKMKTCENDLPKFSAWLNQYATEMTADKHQLKLLQESVTKTFRDYLSCTFKATLSDRVRMGKVLAVLENDAIDVGTLISLVAKLSTILVVGGKLLGAAVSMMTNVMSDASEAEDEEEEETDSEETE